MALYLLAMDHRDSLAKKVYKINDEPTPAESKRIAAGKDFMGEKPFGIDLDAARRIVGAIGDDVFVRCSSEGQRPTSPTNTAPALWRRR